MGKVMYIIFLALLMPGDVRSFGYAGGTSVRKQQSQPAKKVRRYACPMHPEVVSRRPAECRKCGMKLRLVKDKPADSNESASKEAVHTVTNERALPSLRIPDTAVFDQSGRPLRFYTDLVKGKTVAINFIFTTCTTICPPITANFRRVQKELDERMGRDVHLISVSVDPGTDVPERLHDFAAKFKAGPGWTFVTGAKPDIDRLLRSLSAGVADKNDHTALVLIGNEKTGKWARVYGLAPSGVLVKTISGMADRKVE